jgi:hypothetical protein
MMNRATACNAVDRADDDVQTPQPGVRRGGELRWPARVVCLPYDAGRDPDQQDRVITVSPGSQPSRHLAPDGLRRRRLSRAEARVLAGRRGLLETLAGSSKITAVTPPAHDPAGSLGSLGAGRPAASAGFQATQHELPDAVEGGVDARV